MTTLTEETRVGGTARWLPVAAIGVTVVLWASAFVAIRHVAQDVSAGALALGRLLVAGLVLGIAVLVQTRRRTAEDEGWPRRALWPRLLACGVLWLGLYNVALNEAERTIDAGTAAMLVNVGPILIAVLAGLFLGEGFPRQLLVGSLIAFGGVVLIGAATSSIAVAKAWGAALSLVAAGAYATGVITQKPLLAEVSGLRVTWLACVIGAAVCLPFAPALVRDLGSAPASSVWWIVYLGVMPTALAFSTWAYALARSTAGRLGAATYLAPPIAILLGWLLLGETPAALAFVGGAICLAGVYVARRAPRRLARA
ncbi:MAG TPA: DMT family transporter [Micromonosporaceae bacterium]|nr:DMT family transporter [Micromonosporaceae bacterium]